ncbi:MAG: hypothetical protein M3071_14755 [Actinomycetota bacterium]|nr:hypothetical protein [Actinomycetota bacterium]
MFTITPLLLLGAGSTLYVAPNAGVIIWTLIVILIAMALLACGLVTAAKARSGWLIAGLVTGGILWVLGARQAALPRSLWARASTARHARG